MDPTAGPKPRAAKTVFHKRQRRQATRSVHKWKVLLHAHIFRGSLWNTTMQHWMMNKNKRKYGEIQNTPRYRRNKKNAFLQMPSTITILDAVPTSYIQIRKASASVRWAASFSKHWRLVNKTKCTCSWCISGRLSHCESKQRNKWVNE